MNKRDFLNSLKRKLSILDEQEVIDIINEYEDIIDEKVKAGKKEEEAVLEFGSIDELVSEILKTYKLNSKYVKEKEPVKEAVNNIEDWIKSASNSCADFFKNINNGNGISVELVFELIIKFLILLVVLAVLRLPFELLLSLGRGIFNFTMYPLNRVLYLLFSVFLGIAYLVACAFIFITVFKQYFNKIDSSKNVSEKASKKSNEKDGIKKNVKEEKKYKSAPIGEATKVINNPKGDSKIFLKILSGIFKVFMVITFLIPIWMMILGVSLVLCFAIYLSIIGINIWGLIVLFFGILIGLGWLVYFFNAITFNPKKIHFYPIIISIVVITLGGCIFASNIMTFNYMGKSGKLDLEYSIYTEEFDIKNYNNLLSISDNGDYVDYKTDEKIDNDKFIVEVAYPSSIFKIKNIKLEEDDEEYYINIAEFESNDFNKIKEMYNIVIEDLKKGKVYSYTQDSIINIKILANKETMKLIEPKK